MKAPGGKGHSGHFGSGPPQVSTPSDAVRSFSPCLGQNRSITLVSDKILSGGPSQEIHDLSFGFDYFELFFFSYLKHVFLAW